MAASWRSKLPKPTTPQASAMAFCSFTSSLSRSGPVSHLLSGDQRVVLNRRLSLCFPASLETNQWEHPELALLRLNGKTWQVTRRRNPPGSPPRVTQGCSYSPQPESSGAHDRPP